jgi:hypothetical protein
MYLSICFFIVLSWPFVGAEQGKMKLLLLKYIETFLEAKYRAILPEIEEHEKKGIEITKCFSCSYNSAIIIEEIEPLFIQECLVCGAKENLLKFYVRNAGITL